MSSRLRFAITMRPFSATQAFHAVDCEASASPLLESWTRNWESAVYLAALNWRNVPVSEMIGKALKLPAWVDNDANAVAVGEKFVGRARDYVNSTSIVHWGGGCLSDGMESRHLVMPLRNKSNHTTCTLFELAPSLHHSTFRKYSLGLSSKRIYNRFLLLVAGLGGLLYASMLPSRRRAALS
jgi:hypothetical protein